MGFLLAAVTFTAVVHLHTLVHLPKIHLLHDLRLESEACGFLDLEVPLSCSSQPPRVLGSGLVDRWIG